MARDYQPHKSNPYFIERPLYLQTLNLIRSYDTYMQKMHDILMESAAPRDGIPSGTAIVKEVEAKVERREAYFRKTRIIRESLSVIPEEYREGVWNNIVYFERYPNDAAARTYRRYKARYVYEVAKRSGII